MIQAKGLTEREVEESRRQHGTNQLTVQEAETFWDKLIDNFKDPMIIILVVALVVVVTLAIFGFTEWYEGVGIAAAVALATLVATGSEFKNEQTFQKLQEEASKIFLNVFRGDVLTVVGIDDIVVGDQVFLQPGDKIPADGNILQGQVKVNQAMLTGEPEAVKKTPGESDSTDLENPHAVYRGTIVEDGEAVLEVQTVGDNTHFGKLAQDLNVEERPGPLRVKLAKLADDIAKFGYIGASFIAISFMFKVIYMDHAGNMGAYIAQWQYVVKDVVTALILAVIIIVVAVPEGLPMMIAIVLAQNMRKLLKSNVLVRQLLGIETSGSLNLLFSDKTGTITLGQLEAVGFASVNEDNGDHLNTYATFGEMPQTLAKLLDMSLRENTSCVINHKAERAEERILGGNTTERALLRFIKADSQADMEKGIQMLSQVLFNSTRKFSASRVKLSDGKELSLVKGAAEKILAQCAFFYDADGNIQPLAQETKDELSAQMDKKADDGFRIIGVASAEDVITDAADELPDTLCLLGFSLIRDEVREDSKPAIETLQGAGIHVVMLTGDRAGTAKAIARDVALITSDKDVAIRSSELAELSDDEVKNILPDLKVISRCLPQDKTRLVKLAQEMGLVVGMTGDGVNDSPALSNADIGFGLGSGTEVAKEASDIVVLDDNINSISNAVHYGRSIYRSVQKFITFQLTVNVSAILIAFLGPFLGFELPLTMIQLLWVNLIMDTLAALAFSGEPPLPKHMEEKPKDRKEALITSSMWSSILCNGIFIAILSIIFLKSDFVRSLFHSDIAFLTGFFAMFVFLNNFNKFNVRVEEFNLFGHIFKNKGFLQVVGMIFVIQVLITYFGGEMFRTVGLYPQEWFYIMLFSVTIIPFDLLRKYIYWVFE
ncbi:MAG: calcium-translocating P-type ATPase, PMCA-type [Desulfobacteraceae bacterium 4572_88]|nr:MAG: calcium-translocating P-type ATPase, PMCA-type [Desulfobacteraceae bacterium 4572_88]